MDRSDGACDAPKRLDLVKRKTWTRTNSGEASEELLCSSFQVAVTNANDAILLLDARSPDEFGLPRIVYANAAVERRSGFALDEVLGSSVHLFFGPKTEASVTDMHRSLSARRLSLGPVESLLYRKDGTEFRVEISLHPVADETGAPSHWVWIGHDITQHKATQDALRTAQQRCRASGRNLEESQQISQTGSWEVDPATGAVIWSEELYRIFGRNRAEQEPRPLCEFDHPDDAEFVRAAIEVAQRERRPFDIDHRILRADGVVGWVHERGDVVVDEQGNVVRSVGTVQEITGRKLAEEKIRDLLEAAPDGIVEIDDTGRIVLVNKQTESIFGYARDELLGKPVEILMPRQYRDGHPGHRAHFSAHPATRPMGAGLELYGRRKGGQVFPIDISLSAVGMEGGGHAMATIRDITERKQLEEEKKRSDERIRLLQSIIDDAADMVIFTDATPTRDDGPHIVYANPAFIAFTGSSQENLAGRSLMSFVSPRGDRRVLESLALRFDHHLPIAHEILLDRFDAAEDGWVEMTARPLRDEMGVPTAVWEIPIS